MSRSMLHKSNTVSASESAPRAASFWIIEPWPLRSVTLKLSQLAAIDSPWIRRLLTIGATSMYITPYLNRNRFRYVLLECHYSGL